MVEENRSYGWLKDKYNPVAKMHKPAMKTYPDYFSLDIYLPSIRNQGGTSSCVGFGVGGTLGTVSKKQGCFKEWDSPNWIYNGARYLEGWLARDCGCYPEDAMRWVLDMGRLWESDWPFVGFTSETPTSDGRGAKAFKNAGFDYVRVADGVEGLISALAEGNPVNIGTPWPNSWGSYKDGILPEIDKNADLAGGHDTFLYGFDRAANVFFGQNSWGTSWGENGRYKMPMSCFSVFKQMGGYDAHYFSFSCEPIIPDPIEPTPTPSDCPIGKKLAKVCSIPFAVAGRRGRFFYMNPQ